MARDLSRSRAILIGNGSYAEHPRIPDLPGAQACVQAMTALLTGPLCGWPAERITSLVDLAVPSELAVRVVEAVRDAEDVLLVYYVGHGMRTFDGQLALALAGTRPHPETLRHTAMLYPELASILRGARAPTKLVILDCCHAELGHRANYVFQSADLAEAYPVDGLYFIGASGRDAKAKAPADGGLTYFTDAFVTTVTAGIPRQPSTLRLDQIFLELRARLLRANLPEPVEAGTRGAHQFPFARNAAWLVAPPEPSPANTLWAHEQPTGPEARPGVNSPAVPETVGNSKREMLNLLLLDVAGGGAVLCGILGGLGGELASANHVERLSQNSALLYFFSAVATWGLAAAGVGALLGIVTGIWAAARIKSDTLNLDKERLSVRRTVQVDGTLKTTEIIYSVKWSALKSITVEGKGHNAILRAWFHPDHQPEGKWLKKYKIRGGRDVRWGRWGRRDDSFVIYGPSNFSPRKVKADRLCALLRLYAGHVYDDPDHAPEP